MFILVLIHLNTHNPHRDINKYHNSSEVDRSTRKKKRQSLKHFRHVECEFHSWKYKIFNNIMTSTSKHSHSPCKKYTSQAYAMTIIVTVTGAVT